MSLFPLVLALVTAIGSPCSRLEVVDQTDGRLLVSLAPSDAPFTVQSVCLIDGKNVVEVPMSVAATVEAVDWAGENDVFVSYCDSIQGSRRCPIVLQTLEGRRIDSLPKTSSPGFQEPDGRLTPWRLRRPRMSPSGERTLASLRQLIVFSRGDEAGPLTIPVRACEYEWSPDGRTIAYTRGGGPYGGCATERQLFLYDTLTQNERQLSYFPRKEYRPWWNPFAKPLLRPPLVAGLSWAQRANRILFYVAPDRGLFLWTPNGEQVGRIKQLKGRCWRLTQISSDGRRILYLSASTSNLCLINAGNSVRVINADGSDDHLSARISEGEYAIVDIDWRTD